MAAAVAAVARAESGKKEAAAVQAMSGAKLSLADAIRAAEAAGQGIVAGAECEVKKDGAYFDVTTQNGTTEIDHRIDPMTGKILASSPDSEKARLGRRPDGRREERADRAIQGAKVGRLQAVAGAEAQGGRVLSAEYGQEDGSLGIALKVADASGKLSEIMVDAATGKAIVGDYDGEGGQGEGTAGEQQEG